MKKLLAAFLVLVLVGTACMGLAASAQSYVGVPNHPYTCPGLPR